MPIIKSVSLDERTAQIAKELPNFSHFVRECLYRHAITVNSEVCDRDSMGFRGIDRCNPMVQPVCFVCWPQGAPPLEAIKKATEKGQILPAAIPDLDEAARKNNQYLVDLRGFPVQTLKNPGDDRKTPLLKRFKALFGSR